jgi:ABC-2 type transport system ATP-binding protein
MLEVRDIVKTFDGRAAVNRVSFEVRPGEIFALLGPNGAGKTTLIRMITDILKPDSGEILLEGRVIGEDSRRQIAYLPEERGLYRRVSPLDVLVYYGQLKGLSARAARTAGLALLERMELGEWATKQVQTLSKGMQQKVQFCTVLIGEPRLLILDEPFTGLDPLNTLLFEQILAERRAAGSTVLLSTHQMNKVEELCDRALMINQGAMVLYGAVGDFRRHYADHAVMLRCDRQPAAVPGVHAITPVDGEWKLMLDPEASPPAVLRALVESGVNVESFSSATLPLEDVFVKVVREGLGLDHGRSGPVPPPPSGAGGAR